MHRYVRRGGLDIILIAPPSPAFPRIIVRLATDNKQRASIALNSRIAHGPPAPCQPLQGGGDGRMARRRTCSIIKVYAATSVGSPSHRRWFRSQQPGFDNCPLVPEEPRALLRHWPSSHSRVCAGFQRFQLNVRAWVLSPLNYRTPTISPSRASRSATLTFCVQHPKWEL